MYSKLFLTLLLFPLLLTATVQWQENGVPVRQGDNITSLNSLSLSDESFVNIWNDSRDGEQGIYAQRIDSAGDNLWGEQGIEIYKAETMQQIYSTVSTSDNSTIVCWRDYWDTPDHPDEFCFQKIDENGNLLWENSELTSALSGASRLKLHASDEGGVFIVYHSNIVHSFVALKIHEDGTIEEGWENITIIDTYQNNYAICSDLVGGLILANPSNSEDIYIQRINAAGNKLWGDLGILLYNGLDDIDIGKLNVSAKSSNEYLVSWSYENEDYISGFIMESVNDLGESNWIVPAEFQTDYMYKYTVTLLEDSSALVTWKSGDNIFMNKIEATGNVLWEDEELVQIEGMELNFIEDNILLDDEGNCIFIWETRSDNMNRLYIQKIDSDGNFLLPDAIIPLYQTENYGTGYKLSVTNEQYYVSWNSFEYDQQQLKHQMLDYAGNIQLAEMGEAFYSGIGGACRDLLMLDNGDNPVIMWSDTRNRISDQIFLQILNSDGSPQFSENGIPITTFSGYNQVDLDATIGENSGVIAAIWVNEFEDYNGISIQGMDSSGNFLWSDDNGVEIGLLDRHAENPQIFCYNNNGLDEFYVGWNSFSTEWDFDVLAQKIVDGVPQWDEPVIIADNDNMNCTLIDIKDRFFIWEEGIWGQPELMIKLLNEDGSTETGWPDDGILVAAENYNNYSTVVSMIDEGIFITWIDFDSNYTCYIYGQVIDYEGNILWEEEGKLLQSADNIDDCNHLVIGNDIYLNWLQFDSGNEITQCLKKFNIEGEAVWADDYVQLSYGNNNYNEAVLSAVENDVLAVWEHSLCYSDDSMLKAQLVSPNGELAYGEEGLVLSDAFKKQNNQIIYTSGSNAYITWIDGRSTYLSEGISSYKNIYAQKLQLDPTNSPNDVIDVHQLTLTNYPNPFNPTTTILYNLDSDSQVELAIFNIKGQKVRTLVNDQLAVGQYSSIWDGSDDNQKSVSSGIYLYKLKTENQEIVKRMILLK